MPHWDKLTLGQMVNVVMPDGEERSLKLVGWTRTHELVRSGTVPVDYLPAKVTIDVGLPGYEIIPQDDGRWQALKMPDRSEAFSPVVLGSKYPQGL